MRNVCARHDTIQQACNCAEDDKTSFYRIEEDVKPETLVVLQAGREVKDLLERLISSHWFDDDSKRFEAICSVLSEVISCFSQFFSLKHGMLDYISFLINKIEMKEQALGSKSTNNKKG